MNSETLGKYLGCAILFFFMAYIAKEILNFSKIREGLTTTSSQKLKTVLQNIKKDTETLENATGVATNSKLWQDILIQIEDNVNLAMLFEISQVLKANKSGVPEVSSTAMTNILQYNKFKDILRPLDDFLDTYKG